MGRPSVFYVRLDETEAANAGILKQALTEAAEEGGASEVVVRPVGIGFVGWEVTADVQVPSELVLSVAREKFIAKQTLH